MRPQRERNADSSFIFSCSDFFLETFHLCFECLLDRWFFFRSSSSQRLILILVFTSLVARIFLCVVCQLPLAWPHGSKYFCKDPRCFLFNSFSPLNKDTFSCRADTLWFPVGSVWISLLSRGSTHNRTEWWGVLPGELPAQTMVDWNSCGEDTRVVSEIPDPNRGSYMCLCKLV